MPTPNSLPNLLAGTEDLGSWVPTQIFSGEADIVSDGEEVGTAFVIYQVIARNEAGKLVPHDPTAADVGGKPALATLAIGIAAQAGVVGSFAPYYCGGVFNPDAITWHASLTTLPAKRNVFQRTNIQITQLY